MIKKLHIITVFVSVLLANSIQAQHNYKGDVVHILDKEIVAFKLSEHSDNQHNHDKEVFSYSFDSHDHEEDHGVHELHIDDISLIDIISSDEGSDFNCSGGFCMDRSHFHKRGLTIKKQLFDYFMKISC